MTSAAGVATGTTLETGPQFVTTLTVAPSTRTWRTNAGISFARLDLTITSR